MTGRRTVAGRAAAWLLVMLLAQPIAPIAFAQDTAADATAGAALVEEGRRLYDDLEWEDAVMTLLEAIAEDLTPEEQAEAYWLLALTTRALDDLEAAENYLYALVRVDPNFALPATAIGTDFEPLFAAAIAWLVLNEAVTPLQAAGGLVILVGIVTARPRETAP